MTVLALALIGVCVTPMGWIVSDSIFLNEETRAADPFLAETADINRSPYRGVFLAEKEEANYVRVFGFRVSGPRLVFHQIVKPFQAMFRGNASAREFLYFLLGSLWTLAVWSFVGVGIARVCVLRLARNEQAGLDDAFEFAIDKFVTCFAAVAMPLAAVFGLCIPTFIIGLFLGFDIGTLLVGLFWFVVLAISAVMGILLLGLLFSWPLIVSSVATEGQNSFDAMTRAYAYTFQRPIHYLFYLTIAMLFGGFIWLVVGGLTNGIIDLSYWSTSWGANRTSANRIEVIKGNLSPHVRAINTKDLMTDSVTDIADQSVADQDAGVAEGAANRSRMEITVDDSEQERSAVNLERGRKIIAFWEGMLKTVAAAFIYGLFWCMATAVYLLLRRDVDETEMDEVYLVDERRTYDLPPLQSDSDGIPQVQPLPNESDGGSGSEA